MANQFAVKKMITIKRRICVNNDIIQFIRHNSNKRRYIWNKFVNEYIESKKSDIYFDPNRLRESLINEDLNILKSVDETNSISKMYCSDVILGVYKDVLSALRIMHTNYIKYGITSRLQFKSYNPFKRSFCVRTKNDIYTGTGSARGKVIFNDVDKFIFKASSNHIDNRFSINLMEPVCDIFIKSLRKFVSYDFKLNQVMYYFTHKDIKEIVFMEDLGKFYIILKCKVTYCIDSIHKHGHAGIDLGLHTPVTLYYEDNEIPRIVMFKMDPATMSRMKFYERKCCNIQSVMDKKYRINKQRHIQNPNYPKYSKRYRKMQKRLRRYWRLITNIRRQWRFSVCNKITAMYDCIVVDEFTAPRNEELTMNRKLKRVYNHYNRSHAMFAFMLLLKHYSTKRRCMYVESPQYTTRRCSVCGHINPPLSLSERTMVCECCNRSIDRDVNAAINCYDFYSEANAVD